jgi:hypothetical protein
MEEDDRALKKGMNGKDAAETHFPTAMVSSENVRKSVFRYPPYGPCVDNQRWHDAAICWPLHHVNEMVLSLAVSNSYCSAKLW